MNPKQLKLLAAILVVLLIGAYVKHRQPPKALYTQETESLEIWFDANVVDRIVVRLGAKESLELQRTAGQWVVPSLWGVRANAEKITRLLDTLAAVEGEARSHSDELFGDYGITDAQALHLSLFKEESETAHVLIGAESATGNVFLRQAESASVFLSDTRLLSELGIYGSVREAELKTDGWTDLKLFFFEADAVDSVDVKDRSDAWRELGGSLPFDRDPGNLKTYLKGLSGVRANGVVDPEGTGYGFDDPEWELRFNIRGGDPIIVIAGGLREGSESDRYLRVSDAPHVYYATGYTLGRIRLKPVRLLRSNPLDIQHDALQRLTVHAADQEVSVAPAEGEEVWQSLEEYLQSLETFNVVRVTDLPEPSEEPAFGRHWLMLAFEGRAPLTIACEAPPDDDAKEALCVNRGNEVRFVIASATFTLLFEDIGRLSPPALPLEPETSAEAEPEGGAPEAEAPPEDAPSDD